MLAYDNLLTLYYIRCFYNVTVQRIPWMNS
jgi:hypothetical protein